MMSEPSASHAVAIPTAGFAIACLIGLAAPETVVANAARNAQQPTRPNVVFILADDLGYGDIKCFGGDRCRIDTPQFDRLAREGMRFTDAHSNDSVCVPTRMAIMTGRYAWRFGRGVQGGPWGFLGTRLDPGQYTLGDMMREAGYRTGYIGKWHLGTLMQTTDGRRQGIANVDYAKPLNIGPPQYGFDQSFILPGSLDMYPYVFARDNHWIGPVTSQKGWSAFNRVGPAADDFEDTKVLDTFCIEAEQFIAGHQESARAGKPFFLYLALTAPHTPTSPSGRFLGRSRLGVYGDFVMETDDCIGRVLSALDAHGLSENTIVIATSDHGAAPYAGRRRKATVGQLKELEREGHYSCGPFRGYKFSIYEGGFRVPFVVRWPGVVAPGTTCDRLVGLHDLMATLSHVTSVPLGDDRAPDSISMLPLLKDASATGIRQSMILHAGGGFAIRTSDWKLVLCPGSGAAGTWGNSPPRQQAWQEALRQHGRNPKSSEELIQAPFVQLFHISEDLGERANLAAQRPEKVRELAQLAMRTIERGRSTAGPVLNNDRPGLTLFPAVPPFVWKSAD